MPKLPRGSKGQGVDADRQRRANATSARRASRARSASPAATVTSSEAFALASLGLIADAVGRSNAVDAAAAAAQPPAAQLVTTPSDPALVARVVAEVAADAQHKADLAKDAARHRQKRAEDKQQRKLTAHEAAIRLLTTPNILRDEKRGLVELAETERTRDPDCARAVLPYYFPRGGNTVDSLSDVLGDLADGVPAEVQRYCAEAFCARTNPSADLPGCSACGIREFDRTATRYYRVDLIDPRVLPLRTQRSSVQRLTPSLSYIGR